MVLLEGDAAVDVEDRRYRLGPLDAVAVMPRPPRRVANLSADRPAVFHVALALGRARAELDQRPVRPGRAAARLPPAARGPSASVRRADAPVTELAPHAMFQDLYNAELGTRGICGGYGLFEPGARLPCHRHEFDESITIVQGTATCVVEGRRHELAGFATAMVPQGRCHYFINLTLEPMAMIWVYAGDMPDRIVMDEHFCHPEKARTSVDRWPRGRRGTPDVARPSRPRVLITGRMPVPPITASRDWTGTCMCARDRVQEMLDKWPSHAVSAGARALAPPAEGGRLPPGCR